MPPRPKCVCSPFDDADADIIFRSSDDVDFRLYKVIIAKASPVFRTMLELPQPSSSTSPLPGEPHVVNLTEDAKTLENLLRFCYPVGHPAVTSVDDVWNILEAARKYEIVSVTTSMQYVITRFLPEEPLRVYAIAYMLQMEDPARKAAELFLDMPQFHIPPSPPPEFGALPSLAIYAVHIYRQKCAEAALHTFEDRDWILGGSHQRAVRYANGPNSTPDVSQSWFWLTCYSKSHPTLVMGQRPKVCLPGWLEKYLDALKVALKERPSGRTLRSFLSSAWGNEVLSGAISCSDRMRKAYADMSILNGLLAEKVDEAVAQIRIELPFSVPKRPIQGVRY